MKAPRRKGARLPTWIEDHESSPDLEKLSPAQRWRLRRDVVIFIAWSHGASMRILADVFDLPHSRISIICKAIRERYGPDAP
jgi:hypothetical protein